MRALLESLVKSETAGQFSRFFVVGGVGFAVDGGLTQLLVTALNFSPFTARVPAFLVAVLVTWALNRKYTFKASANHPCLKSLAAYLSGNLIGISVNLGVYYAVLALLPALKPLPIVPVAAGSVSAMFVNFALAKWWVFRGRDEG